MLASEVEELISRALAEDIGPSDLTGDATVEAGTSARALITQKAPGALFGFAVAEATFRRLDPLLEWEPKREEGEWIADVPEVVVELKGDARGLLAGERTALNFLGHLSGVTTATALAVEAVRGTGVEILDTRKTTPGLRVLEKQAVLAGGGRNHRMGLFDAMLVKENHIAIAGGIGAATRLAIERRPHDCPVEVECRTLADVEGALAAGADHLLLDNMSVPELRATVDAVAGRASLEASGGVTVESIREVAGTGVQFISLGSLTHSAPALDLSMSVEPSPGR
ncbi:MAG: carboxylating nicotinate-nucleotide diphosphorylase [Solirubrobacterales bacterium]